MLPPSAVREASRLFADAGLPTKEEILGASRLAELGRWFQQRHVLAHNDGVVDQDHVDKTGDTRYSVGQRLVIRQEDVEGLAAAPERLTAALAG